MKICYFIGELQRGGAEALLLDICKNSTGAPYEVVCVYRKEGNLTEAFKRTNARLFYLPKNGSMVQYVWNLRKLMLRENPDVVHSQTPSNTLALALALAGMGVKVVTTFHGHSFVDAPLWKRAIVYLRSNRIVCVSRYQKEVYLKKWGWAKERKFEVVYNGIDFGKLPIRKVPNKKPDTVRLCMVGSFCSGRSQYVLIDAMKLLKDEGKEEGIELDFVGGIFPSEEHIYETCIRKIEAYGLIDQVKMLGVRNDVPQLLEQSNGYVYSTVSDTFGISVIEAMAVGLPVMVNDWAVMKEVVEKDGQQNEVQFFRSQDVVDCAEKLCKFVNQIREGQIVGGKNVWVREHYQIEKHIEELYKVYKKL